MLEKNIRLKSIYFLVVYIKTTQRTVFSIKYLKLELHIDNK